MCVIFIAYSDEKASLKEAGAKPAQDTKACTSLTPILGKNSCCPCTNAQCDVVSSVTVVVLLRIRA